MVGCFRIAQGETINDMKTRDVNIRSSLQKYITDIFKYDETTKIVHELNVCYGAARVDIAAINGSLYGYEIKSDSDTLERLPKQKDIYNKVFDYINLVCSEVLLENAEKIIPDWWGIYIAQSISDETVSIIKIREAKLNTEIDSFSLAQFLRKDEVVDILKELGAEKRIFRLPKYVLWNELAENCPLNYLREKVRIILKTRYNC